MRSLEAEVSQFRITSLADALREAVRAAPTPEAKALAAAKTMEPFLADPDLLDEAQRRGDTAGYRQHLLHADPDDAFSVVALVWLPGQATPIHDHVCWCATGVYQGSETEECYKFTIDGDKEGLAFVGEQRNPAGTVTALVPPGDIHSVRNGGDGTAISIHVYGADISRTGSSVRRIYHR